MLQAAINATSLALVSAGIPMSDYVCGLALASYPSVSPTAPPQIPPFELSSTDGSTGGGGGAGASGSTVLIDLVQAEEQALPCATIACTPRSGHVTLASLESRLSVDRFEQLLRWGVEGSKVIRAAMEDVRRSSPPARIVADILARRLCTLGPISSQRRQNCLLCPRQQRSRHRKSRRARTRRWQTTMTQQCNPTEMFFVVMQQRRGFLCFY